MLTLVSESIDAYALRHSEPEPALLSELAAETRRLTKWPQMMVGPVEGSLLKLLVRLLGARRALELGTFTGYSAHWIAAGLPEDGRLVTCDVSEEYAAIARRFWARSPHASKIDLRLGPALETIRTLEDGLDFAFIDADKANYPSYWDAVVPKLRPGGVLVADNVLWSGKVLEPADEETRAIDAFNRKAAADPRVERVLLTVRDGMMVVVRK